jgi:hypothetical protein
LGMLFPKGSIAFSCWDSVNGPHGRIVIQIGDVHPKDFPDKSVGFYTSSSHDVLSQLLLPSFFRDPVSTFTVKVSIDSLAI